jgi:hypothetical protein
MTFVCVFAIPSASVESGDVANDKVSDNVLLPPTASEPPAGPADTPVACGCATAAAAAAAYLIGGNGGGTDCRATGLTA